MNKLAPRHLGGNGPLLVFGHANGYPPEAYRTFLEPFLHDYQVFSLYLRSFWPDTNPNEMRDWRTFRDDYLPEARSIIKEFAGRDRSNNQLIGMGHSLGAMTTLFAAIQDSSLFRILVLIEPVLFPRLQGTAMRLLAPFKVLKRFHPLIQGTLKRKTRFDTREAMYQNYRAKPVFSGLSDQVLQDYVAGLVVDLPAGGVGLKYSPAWEARIYETGGIADWVVWRNLDRVQCPVLIIRGEFTYSLSDRVIKPIIKRLPKGEVSTLAGAGHLVPLEQPGKTAEIILEFLKRNT